MARLVMSPEALQLAKDISHEIWEKYDDTHGYRTEKQQYNQSVTVEVPDNIWFFWGQFDSSNHAEFLIRVTMKPDSLPGKKELLEFVKGEINRENEALVDIFG